VKLGWNIAAGFANSAWTAVVALAVVPFSLHYLGIDAFGLIGFYTALQALFGLLDMGLAATINREVARSKDDPERADARNLLHTLAVVYWSIAALIAAVAMGAAPLIGDHWLKSAALPHQAVTQTVMLMGLVIALRFPLGLYLGALMGAQRMVTVSGIEISMVTIANIGAVIVLALISPTIQAYFIWQALIGALNVVVTRTIVWRALRDPSTHARPRFDGAGLRRIWRFSAGMGITAVIGVIFMQSDKVILSKVVSLATLGRYTLAGLAGRSLYVFLTPVFGAAYPRLTTLYAEGAEARIEAFYRTGTRLLLAILFPVAFFVSTFSNIIFTAWTGNSTLAESIGPTVSLILLGSALNGAMHFPYALQLACGRSDLSVLINLILLLVYAPLVWFFAHAYGIVGCAAAWAILNALYLLLGAWVTHRTLLRGVGLKWLVSDVGIPFVASLIVTGAGCYAVRGLDLNPYITLFLGALLVGAGFLAVVALTPTLTADAKRLSAQYFENRNA
jgi:O-antigen/teichoic acid export membrane protein